MIGAIHFATGGEAIAYAALALAAIAGTASTVFFSRRTLDHQVTSHKEKERLAVYSEFIAALTKARSNGHTWHNAIRDRLTDSACTTDGFFLPDYSLRVNQVAHSSNVREERELYYQSLDGLWVSAAKVKMVGPPSVALAADELAKQYDPRQRGLSADILQEFHLDPGYPLTKASERQKAFMSEAIQQLPNFSHP